MGVNVYAANGRMKFSVVVAGLTHDLHYACEQEVHAPFTGGYALVGNDPGGTDIDPQDAADIWWSLAKTFYPNSVTGASWELSNSFGGVFVPVAAGACAGGAGTGGVNVLTSVVTLTFSDQNNFLAKFTFPETSFPLPYHTSLVSDVTGLGDFAASVLSIDTGIPSVGAWVRSRSNGLIELSRFANNTLSKRLRRIRGYV